MELGARPRFAGVISDLIKELIPLQFFEAFNIRLEKVWLG